MAADASDVINAIKKKQLCLESWGYSSETFSPANCQGKYIFLTELLNLLCKIFFGLLKYVLCALINAIVGFYYI